MEKHFRLKTLWQLLTAAQNVLTYFAKMQPSEYLCCLQPSKSSAHFEKSLSPVNTNYIFHPYEINFNIYLQATKSSFSEGK